MATHSSILVWKITRTEEPGGLHYSPWGRKESDATKHTHTSTKVILHNIKRSPTSRVGKKSKRKKWAKDIKKAFHKINKNDQ